MVDHDIFLDKLYHYGIRGIAHAWFKSCLSDRKQYVVLNNKFSSILDMLYGVPQGSILGPLLFLIYVNDISNISKIILYADDANILITGHNMYDIMENFKIISKNLELWVIIMALI